MVAGAKDHAAHGADVAIVAAPAERDVLHGGEKVVGRIDVNPADARTKKRNPRVRGIRAEELLLAGRRLRFKIAADIARGQAERAEAGDLQMREVLADAPTLLQHFAKRR